MELGDWLEVACDFDSRKAVSGEGGMDDGMMHARTSWYGKPKQYLLDLLSDTVDGQKSGVHQLIW